MPDLLQSDLYIIIQILQSFQKGYQFSFVSSLQLIVLHYRCCNFFQESLIQKLNKKRRKIDLQVLYSDL